MIVVGALLSPAQWARLRQIFESQVLSEAPSKNGSKPTKNGAVLGRNQPVFEFTPPLRATARKSGKFAGLKIGW
jgi:hypothetical protein